MSVEPPMRLIYQNARGVGEPIRIVLCVAGIKVNRLTLHSRYIHVCSDYFVSTQSSSCDINPKSIIQDFANKSILPVELIKFIPRYSVVINRKKTIRCSNLVRGDEGEGEGAVDPPSSPSPSWLLLPGVGTPSHLILLILPKKRRRGEQTDRQTWARSLVLRTW